MPMPVVEAAARLLPDGVLVPLAHHGHSALGTRPTVLLEGLRSLASGDHHHFPEQAVRALADAPVTGAGRALPVMLRASLAADRVRTVRPGSRRGRRRPTTAGRTSTEGGCPGASR